MVQQAQDTFVADLKDGTSVRVVKGEPYPDGHELVKRDAAAAQAAADAGVDRAPLFKPLDMGEEETPAPKARTPRSAARASS